MKPSPFVHHAPRSLDEALAVLAEFGHDGKVLAGGQSLIPILNMRLAAPGHLVDINRIAGLDTVEVTRAAVHIRALVRQAQLEPPGGALAHLALLGKARAHAAHPARRTRGPTAGPWGAGGTAGSPLPAGWGRRCPREVQRIPGCSSARRESRLGARSPALQADIAAAANRFPA